MRTAGGAERRAEGGRAGLSERRAEVEPARGRNAAACCWRRTRVALWSGCRGGRCFSARRPSAQGRAFTSARRSPLAGASRAGLGGDCSGKSFRWPRVIRTVLDQIRSPGRERSGRHWRLCQDVTSLATLFGAAPAAPRGLGRPPANVSAGHTQSHTVQKSIELAMPIAASGPRARWPLIAGTPR